LIEATDVGHFGVYKIIDPRDNLPFYIGQTSRPIDKRFHEHLHDIENQAKSERLAEIYQEGLIPTVEEIESVWGTYIKALERETYWIQHYRSEGINLTNLYVRIDEMKRQTVYMPAGLARWLKVHAAATGSDISSIITDLVVRYRDEVDKK
jgi:sugar-specific transcriptional regulator TrmB